MVAAPASNAAASVDLKIIFIASSCALGCHRDNECCAASLVGKNNYIFATRVSLPFFVILIIHLARSPCSGRTDRPTEANRGIHSESRKTAAITLALTSTYAGPFDKLLQP
jgi:hypothetical protein